MAKHIANLTPEIACEMLHAAGLCCSPDEIQIVAREERWAVALPGERLAWFPASESGSRRLAVERRVLRLLGERCFFRVPRTLLVSESGFEIRQMVPGRCDPWGLFERCKRDSELAQRVGRSLGAILAEQHTAIGEAEVTGWLPRRVAWPEQSDWIRERLPRVVDDKELVFVIESTIERYEAVAVDAGDHVLVHGDAGLHNLALDPETDAVNGIFDYDGAAWADRHHDFRYLLFDVGREDMLDAALAVYEPAIGRKLDRGRIRLYNAACAITYLAFRSGTRPEQKSCGRTLAEDLRWVRTALSKIT
ncbi:MAG: phosphotransferase [Alphaproteobacteria bacterium]|nr:phosphotransferase [Alphaproteobacteria bacterium]